jgi:hypothetical protein
MNNCTQWSSVFTMVLMLKLRVLKVNIYFRFVEAQEANAGAEGTDQTTVSQSCNDQGDVLVH